MNSKVNFCLTFTDYYTIKGLLLKTLNQNEQVIFLLKSQKNSIYFILVIDIYILVSLL